MKTIKYLFYIFPLFFGSCKEFLDVKPDSRMATIEKKEEIWALLNNELIFNTVTLAGEEYSDNYYVKDDVWNSSTNEALRNKYIWSNTENDGTDWTVLYQRVYYANVILESAEKIKENIPKEEYYNMVGIALYCRSLYFYELLSIYSMPYKIGSNSTALGIPLRTSSDINKAFPRMSAKECIDRIITDLNRSAELLPVQAQILTKPSKIASWGLLARIYLDISDYENAFIYAEKVLAIKSDLLDYNTVDEKKPTPFHFFNSEVIHITYKGSPFITQSRGIIDSALFSYYTEKDRRTLCFFTKNKDGKPVFKGSYMQSVTSQFTGLTTAEIYLISVESAARLGKLEVATEKLKAFLKHRYLNGSEPSIIANREDLADLVLRERRKELLFRGRRWTDIKRLNLEGANIVLRRYLNGRMYQLKPNSKEYAVLIPLEAIKLGGITQNER